MRKVPLLLIGLTLAILTVRGVRKERKRRKMSGLYQKCDQCNQYYYSEQEVCPDGHTLKRITDEQRSHLAALFLNEDVEIETTEEEKHVLGCIHLDLEGTTGKRWYASITLWYFFTTDEARLGFCQFMCDYDQQFGTNIKPSTAFRLWTLPEYHSQAVA